MSETIVVERRVAAPRPAVYRHLVSSEGWVKWQGESAVIEASPGGLFSLVMANGLNARGQFLELQPDRRVVFTWGWIDRPEIPPGSTTVEIDLADAEDDGGTIIRLTHRNLAPGEAPMHEQGWRHYVARLAIAATGHDPGPDPGAG